MTINPNFHQHSKACLADAVISAVQNFRDNPAIGQGDFREVVEGATNSLLLDEAEGYLRDGLQDCKCHVEPIETVQRTYRLHGRLTAINTARAYMNAKRITVQDFAYVAGWIDREVIAAERRDRETQAILAELDKGSATWGPWGPDGRPPSPDQLKS